MQVTGASTRWGFVCYVPLVNDAVAQVLSGALHLNGGGLNGGTLLTAADSTLDFPAGTYTNAGYYEIGGSTSIGQTAGSTGVLALASGTFIATNSPVLIGPAGGGVLTISGGNVTLGQVTLGGTTTTASGELSLLAGGHLTILSNASANFIRVDGGGLDGSGGTVIVGQNHSANMVVSAGTATNIGTLFVGYSPGFTGTFTQSGGAVGVTKSLIVGDCGSNSTGVFTMSGGALYITNAAHTATLDVRQGIFLFNGGTLVVDAIVTNGCGGAFINSGGTLIFQPVQPPPVFQVVTRMGNAVTMTWSASASRAYQLQYKTNLNQFAWADLGSVITATNSAASASDAVNPDRQRFYRVVMLP